MNQPCMVELTGEKGFRTAICQNGLKYGDFYFEVEILAHQIPTPFLDVTPAVRIGFTNFNEQNVELPIGCKKRSYAYH